MFMSMNSVAERTRKRQCQLLHARSSGHLVHLLNTTQITANQSSMKMRKLRSLRSTHPLMIKLLKNTKRTTKSDAPVLVLNAKSDRETDYDHYQRVLMAVSALFCLLLFTIIILTATDQIVNHMTKIFYEAHSNTADQLADVELSAILSALLTLDSQKSQPNIAQLN